MSNPSLSGTGLGVGDFNGDGYPDLIGSSLLFLNDKAW
jgi:hypothetical protein